MKKLLFASLLALAGFLPACQFDPGVVICEDGVGPGPTPTVPASLQQLYTQLGAPVQTFTYDPSRTNTFTSKQGTLITLPAQAFRKHGQVVTGPVQLSFREIFSRADMVLSSMPTVASKRLLESAGELYLRADQDTALRLAPGAIIKLHTQNPHNLASADSMKLFVGRSGPACFDWVVNSPSSGATLEPTATGNILTVTSLLYNQGVDWLNCDRFYEYTGPRSPIVAKVSGDNIDPETNTMVFAVFRSINGAVRLCDFNKTTTTFETSGIPVNLPVSVVVIRTVNSKLYYGREDGLVQAGTVFAPALTETTAAALVDNLNNL